MGQFVAVAYMESRKYDGAFSMFTQQKKMGRRDGGYIVVSQTNKAYLKKQMAEAIAQ